MSFCERSTYQLIKRCKKSVMCENVCINGSLKQLQWSVDSGCAINDKCSVNAALHSHPNIIEYLIGSNNINITLACIYGAQAGCIPILDMMVKLTDDWEYDVLYGASTGGHIHVFEWVSEQLGGIPMPANNLLTVSINNHFQCLQWLYYHGHPISVNHIGMQTR